MLTPADRTAPTRPFDPASARDRRFAAAAEPAAAQPELQALRNQVAQARDRERAWLAVSDTVRDLTVLREPDRVLQAIVERGRALLGSHVAWIAGPDHHHDDTLVVLAIDGVSTEWAQQMRAASGRGVVGYVRQTRSPFATADYFAETRVVHDARIDATLRSEGVQSMVAMPLLSGTDFLGVLVLADRAAREYSHPDIATLGMLAAHAVVAIRNAEAYARTRSALAQAEQSNALLQQKSAALELAADAHERLTRLVARGGSLLDVCQTVAELLDATVALVDATDTVLCSATPQGSPATHRSDVPHCGQHPGMALHAALDASRLSGRSVALPDAEGSTGRLAAIVGGGRLLGGLVASSAAPLSDVALRTLERSALVLAVLLLAPDLPVRAAANRPEGLLLDLLNPLRAGSAALVRQAAAQGLQDAGAAVLALLLPTGASRHAVTAAVVRRLRARLDPRRTLVDELDDTVVVLASRSQPEALRQTLQRALDDEPRLRAAGLVSAPCIALAALPSTLAALQRGLALLDRLGHGGAIRLLTSLAPCIAAFSAGATPDSAALSAYIDANVGPLLARDRARGTRLSESLLVYLDLGHNAKAAAHQLGVHVNTLNNRLTAATALLEPLQLPGCGLEVHLALRLAALQAPLGPKRAS